MSWVNVAIAVGSAVYSGYQSNKQSNAMKAAGRDPLRRDRKKYAADLMALLDDPSSLYSMPMYQAAFGEGQQAVTRNMAAQGYLGSGNMAVGLQKYGMSFGYDMFDKYSKFLANLAGFEFDNRDSSAMVAGGQQAYLGTQDMLGQLGAIWGTYGPKGSAGTPAGGGGGMTTGM